jgi:capsular exopolysaccharide synthesis family protein
MNSRGRSSQVARLEEQKLKLMAEMQRLQVAEQQRVKSQYENSPNLMVKLAKKMYDQQYQVIGAQMAALDIKAKEIVEKINQQTKSSAVIAQRQEDLARQAELVDAMGQKLALWDVEQEAGSRIKMIQQAVARESINTIQRYAIAAIGGIIMLGLTCFGIGYMEFQNRRLDAPTQVDEGLGIRVVGTLPPLSGRRVTYEGDPIVATLMESIDSIRTTLMHDAAAKDRRVVLVTSATTLEGRTTVASQLAASLARAGRRTLLIDGDLRHPALHTLFDLPLEDGLCEVLRTEAELDEAVRPTHAEGLWLLTAGNCDLDAIQAMANDQLQPIFEKLRSEFDFIIVDGAPVLGLPDSLIIGQNCDAAILAVLRDSSQVPKIYQAAEQLKAVGVKLIGAVVNGVRSKTDTRVVRPHLAAPRVREEEPEEEPVEMA